MAAIATKSEESFPGAMNSIELIFVRDANGLKAFPGREGLAVLDADRIDAEVAEMSEAERFTLRGDYINGGFYFLSQAFAQRISWRVANRFAGRVSERWAVPSDVLANAMFFPFWSSLASIVTYRRLVRRLASKLRLDDIREVVIPLPSLILPCFSYWASDHTAVLFLGERLAKAGFRVCFAVPGPEPRNHVRLRFVPSKEIQPFTKLWRTRRHSASANFICEEGVRRAAGILDPSAPLSALEPRPWLGELETEALYGTLSRPRQNPVDVPFHLVERKDGVARFRGSCGAATVNAVIDSFWRDMATKGWESALDLVKRRKIENVFVCDHHFFSSALVAGAAKACGARVTLLPHSTNPLHVAFRKPDSFDKAVAVTEWAAEQWRRQFPGKPVQTRSDMMFPAVESPRRFVAGAPLSFVAFGGADSLGAFPLLHRRTHAATWAKIASMPETLEGRIKLFYKPRLGWKDADWEAIMAGSGGAQWTVETNRTPDIERPNLVFACVSLASSAQLEGIARGIPVIHITDQDVANYVPVEGSAIPLVRSSELWAVLDKLCDADAYNHLAEQQAAWFRRAIIGPNYVGRRAVAERKQSLSRRLLICAVGLVGEVRARLTR